MLYLIHGSDTDKTLVKFQALISALRVKRPDAEVFNIQSDSFKVAEFENLIVGQGLFEQKYIVVANSICEVDTVREEIVTRLLDMTQSPNVFVFREGVLDTKTKKEFEKHATKQEEHVVRKGEEQRFNIFSLADALGRRDSKALWVLYTRALRACAVPEEIHGTLAWQVRSMLATSVSKSADEAGQKPFTYSKAKQFLRNYTSEELKKMSSELVALYHDAHRGIHDLDIALERWILRV
jgi:hypothetical protein